MENESKLKLIFHKNVFSYRFKPYIFFNVQFLWPLPPMEAKPYCCPIE